MNKSALRRPSIGRAFAGLLLASLLTPAAAFADEPAAADETKEAAPVFRCVEGLTLPLEGLTEDNVKDVKVALKRMTRPRYRCPACKMQADQQATCEGCGELYEQLEHGVPLFEYVQLDTESGRACLELDASGVLSLRAAAEALEPTGVRLDRAKLDIGAWTRITVRMDPNDVGKAKKALQRPGLFASVGVRVSEGSPSTSFIIQHPPRKPITLARVAGVLNEAAGGGVVFEDVSWAAACLTCSEKGRRRGSCRACWQAEMQRERIRERLR